MPKLVLFAARLHQKLQETISYLEFQQIQKRKAEYKAQFTQKPKFGVPESFAADFLLHLPLENARFLKTLPSWQRPLGKELAGWSKNITTPLPAIGIADLKSEDYIWKEEDWQAFLFFKLASREGLHHLASPKLWPGLAKLAGAESLCFGLFPALWTSKRIGSRRETKLNLAFGLLPLEELEFCLANLHSKEKIYLQTSFQARYNALYQPRPNFNGASGVYIDLKPILNKVLNQWFPQALAHPVEIVWGKKFNCRILGFYEFLKCKISISLIFDSPRVDPLVLEYLVFHELLHHAIGVQFQNQRLRAHTPLFKKIEQSYPDMKRLELELKAYAYGKHLK